MNQKTERFLLGLMPKSSMCDLALWAVNRCLPAPLLRSAIRSFSAVYKVDLNEMEEQIESFRTFDEFFTRRLADGARPIDPDPLSLVSPSDGCLSEFGTLNGSDLLQVKGKHYSIADLLGSESRAEAFIGGSYTTIYLSPRNYHRVHFPCSGEVTDYHYIPGELFPVNAMSVRSIDHLFSRNERLVTYLDSNVGPVAVVMVAATCVSAIEPCYDTMQHVFERGVESGRVYQEEIQVEKGEELGVFHMGSTVVMVFPAGTIEFGDLELGQEVRMGQKVATCLE